MHPVWKGRRTESLFSLSSRELLRTRNSPLTALIHYPINLVHKLPKRRLDISQTELRSRVRTRDHHQL